MYIYLYIGQPIVLRCPNHIILSRMAIHIKKSRDMRHNMASGSSNSSCQNHTCGRDQSYKRAIFRRKLESVKSCSSQEQTFVSSTSKDCECHIKKWSPSPGVLEGNDSVNRSLYLTKLPNGTKQQDIATDRRHSSVIARCVFTNCNHI